MNSPFEVSPFDVIGAIISKTMPSFYCDFWNFKTEKVKEKKNASEWCLCYNSSNINSY